MIYEEEIICHLCNSEYKIVYNNDNISENITFCSCCGEELSPQDEDEEYIDEETEDDE